MFRIIFLTALLSACSFLSATPQNYQHHIDSIFKILSSANDDVKIKLYGELLTVYDVYKPEEGLKLRDVALALAAETKKEINIARIKDKVGRLYWRTGNFREAYKYHYAALDIYERHDDNSAVANVLIWLGQDYLNDNNYDSARKYLLKAIVLGEKINDKKIIARSYDKLIALYQVQGNYAETSKAIYAYLKVNEELGDKKGMAYAYASLADNFKAIGNNTEALKQYQQSLALSIEENDMLHTSHLYSGIGDLYADLENFTEAEKSYKSGIKVAEKMENGWIIWHVLYRGIGNVYRRAGNLPEALHYLLLGKKELQAISSNHALARLYSELGMVYTQLKKYNEAKAALDSAMILCTQLDTAVPLGDYYSGMQMLDSATGNWNDAYNHFKEYVRIKDSSFNKETLKKLVATQMQYEQEKKDVQAEEELRRQRNIRNSAFAVLAVVLLFSVIAYRQRNKIAVAKKRSDQLLKDKELLLREIHHRVKNNLEVVSSLLALQSAQIDDPGTKEAMLEGQNRVHSIGIVHQKLYQGENPGAIEMKDYFLNLSESILDSFGSEDRITIKVMMEKINVDIDTAVPLGLIVNELLTNTLKYAFPANEPGSVIIKLEKRNTDILHLEVSDNGIGKTGITQGTGFGAQLISLLTQQLHGTMKEEIKEGTHTYFDFKIEKPAPGK